MKITVAELKKHLETWPDDMEILFGAEPGLDFYRVKQRGEKLLQVEFSQSVYNDSNGHWHVEDPD
jgi:hypothetical protein